MDKDKVIRVTSEMEKHLTTLYDEGQARLDCHNGLPSDIDDCESDWERSLFLALEAIEPFTSYAKEREGPVDLRSCKGGDILISCLGGQLTYIRLDYRNKDWPHLVQYENGSMGSRTDTGHVMRNPKMRLGTDHDIVSIIHKGEHDDEL
jgi:hypothetical protein